MTKELKWEMKLYRHISYENENDFIFMDKTFISGRIDPKR